MKVTWWDKLCLWVYVFYLLFRYGFKITEKIMENKYKKAVELNYRLLGAKIMGKSCYKCINFKATIPKIDGKFCRGKATATCKLGLLRNLDGTLKAYHRVFSPDNWKRVKGLQKIARKCEHYEG